MANSYLNLNDQNINSVVQNLNQLLADYHVYYQKLRNFHWNVKGENFYRLHEVFEDLYNDAFETIDDLAERIQTLGYLPLSKMEDYLKVSDLNECDPLTEDVDMVKELVKDHEVLIKGYRAVIEKAENANDEATIDLTAGLLRDFEKSTWMLHSWLGNKVQTGARQKAESIIA